MNMEEFDARLLLEQLLGEAEFSLRDSGFGVQHIKFSGDCPIKADPLYLKRVVDNLVSDVKKYADSGCPVVFISELRDSMLSVCISNRISRSIDSAESAKIGIRTCEKIMRHMGGSFDVSSDGEHFAAEFRLHISSAREEPGAPAG